MAQEQDFQLLAKRIRGSTAFEVTTRAPTQDAAGSRRVEAISLGRMWKEIGELGDEVTELRGRIERVGGGKQETEG